MPTLDWLKKEFQYGYDSGNILSLIPNSTRRNEEKAVGGSYRKIFLKALLPHIKPDSKILELGPGKGAWSRAILKHIPQGQLHTIDYQDVSKWLNPEKQNGRLVCHKVENNSCYSKFEDDFFDFCWSFGVLCHNNLGQIEEILKNILPKMKHGGMAIHMYADWDKLDKYGWEKGRVPLEFKDKPDNDIWWPRNNQKSMSSVAVKAGWTVISSDLGLIKRDSIIALKRE
jgi:phospholipid N-methyltransferase